MDAMTCFICILIIALWLSCIAIGCVVIDTVLAIKRYINDKHYIMTQENIVDSGGNSDDEI